MGRILFKNGRIIDGTGIKAFKADLLIDGDIIVHIGKWSGPVDQTIDCTDKVITPGFIDAHNHSDYSVLGSHAENYVAQGVTSLITGYCGQGAVPVGYINSEDHSLLEDSLKSELEGMTNFQSYTDLMEKRGTAINTGFLLPHGSIRSFVMGNENRKPTNEELESMKSMVKEGMSAGALGLSTGLAYIPSKYAEPPEIESLLEEVGRYDGIYSSHMRNQGDYIVDAIIETVDTARRTGARPLISHIKATNKNKGLSETEIKLIDYYRNIGIEVDWDIYSYVRSGANIIDKIKKNLNKPITDYLDRNELQPVIDVIDQVSVGRSWNDMIIRDFDPEPLYEGKSITEISEMLNKDIYNTLFEIYNIKPDVDICSERSYEDMINFFQHPECIAGSDGYIGSQSKHPRSYGAFMKILTEFVFEKRFLTLEGAVKRMTWNAARKLRIKDRGMIKEGMKADLVVFNPSELRLEATFKSPKQNATGMSHVIMNGVFVIMDKAFTGARPGEVIKNYMTIDDK